MVGTKERYDISLTESLTSWLEACGGWSGEEGEDIATDLRSLNWRRGRGAKGSVSYNTLAYLVEIIETITDLPEFRHESRAGARFLAEHAGKVEGAPAKLHPIIAKLTSKKGSDMAQPSEEPARMTELHTRGESETMTAKKTAAPAKPDVNKDAGKAVVEQIDANVERLRHLANLHKESAAKELAQETEELISSLSGKGVAAIKATKRAEVREASTVPEPKAEIATRETRDYKAIEGAQELINMGAEKFAEGVRLDQALSNTGREIAAILLDMWRRMTTKDGLPDLKCRSQGARDAASAMYTTAGSKLEGTPEQVQESVKKLQRSVQHQMNKLRVDYVRSLDESKEEAAHFTLLTAKADDDRTVSQIVADHYGISLVSKAELEASKLRKMRELAAKADAGDELTEGEAELLNEAQEQSAEDRIRSTMKAAVTLLISDDEEDEGKILRKAASRFKKLDDSDRAAARAEIDALIADLAKLSAQL